MSEEYKYRSNFPLRQYLERYYPDGVVNSRGQFHASCPRCVQAGLRDVRKFYYDINKMKGLCQRCHVGGDVGGINSLASLVMFTENIENYASALYRLKSLIVIDNIDSMIDGEIYDAINLLTHEEEIEDVWDIPIEEDIPYCIPVDIKRFKTFLSSRNPSMNINIIELFPVYFSKAKFLHDRAVFKIETNNSYAWLAYALHSKIEPKTLNPVGSVLSYMLGGYNYVSDDAKPLLIVEGLFDMFRCLLRGYNAVCSFSNKLSARQVFLLNESKATEIVFCYDSEITGQGWKGVWSAVKKWGRSFCKPLSMMKLPLENKNKNDADSVSARGCKHAYKNREAIRF